MDAAPDHPRDPVGWTVAITLAFGLLCLIRLTIPSQPYFDEVHYLPAARALLDLSGPVNREHPMLAKELMALSMAFFGDRPFGWRFLSVVAGAGTLFAFMRALWFASRSRFATLAGGVLLATSFPLFVQSRIAMLDVFMAAFIALAWWQLAATMHGDGSARRRLAIAGAALGCALACKWTAVPLAVLPGIAFLIIRLEAAGPAFLTARGIRPVPGITLIEAGIWLGLVPLLVYFASFWPVLFYQDGRMTLAEILPFQLRMMDLQSSVIESHTYQSNWYHWALNWRAIWYLYERVDGAQRGVLLVGNPLTMLAGLPALAWCAFVGLFRRRWDALAVALLYAAAIGFWMVAAKPVQFYYHYLLAGSVLMAALSLWLDHFWQRGNRWLPLGVIALSCALFAWFFPILTAARLGGPMSFLDYTWLASWI